MEIEGIEMSDLVQKIADAVVPMLWIGDDEADSRARVESAIRQALADAGGAVAYIDEAGTLYPCAESIKNYLPKGRTATPLHTHPAPTDSGRVAELEAQLAAEQGLSERWRQRTLAAEKQLAESEKKREAVTSDWSKLGAKLGLLQMQLGATERQLAESRELEGRMRGVLEAFDKAARESGSIIGFAGKAVKLITHARAALAAEQEKK